MATPENKLTICIDRGGTFTDCIGFLGKPGAPGTREFVVKLLSEDPANYKDAPTEGIRRIVEMATGRKIERNQPVPTDMIGILPRERERETAWEVSELLLLLL